jgi:hypothetical protein
MAALTRARESPPIPASCETELRRAERPARAGAAAAGRRRHFFLADCCSQIRGDDGARPIGAIDDDLGGRRRASAARYGVIGNDRQILQHRQWAALIMLSALTRAREAAPIPTSSDADRPAPAGWVALRLLADVDISF